MIAAASSASHVTVRGVLAVAVVAVARCAAAPAPSGQALAPASVRAGWRHPHVSTELDPGVVNGGLWACEDKPIGRLSPERPLVFIHLP